MPAPTGKAGDWLPGTLRINPGSLIWVPEPGVPAVPVDLTRAVIVNVMSTGKRGGAFANVEIDTPAGRVQLEQDPDMFAMTLELVAEEAAWARPAHLGPGRLLASGPRRCWPRAPAPRRASA